MTKYLVVYYTMSDCTATVGVYADSPEQAAESVRARDDCDTVVTVVSVAEVQEKGETK